MLASMASRSAGARNPFDALPPALLRRIMLALPPDTRARCACVCRGWRAFLADPSLWQVLDLSLAGGVTGFVMPALVRGAAARAEGQLRVFKYDFHNPYIVGPSGFDLLREVALANAAALRELQTNVWLEVRQVRELLVGAPRLEKTAIPVTDSPPALLPLLRREPPFGLLHATSLEIHFYSASRAGALDTTVAVAAYNPIQNLTII